MSEPRWKVLLACAEEAPFQHRSLLLEDILEVFERFGSESTADADDASFDHTKEIEEPPPPNPPLPEEDYDTERRDWYTEQQWLAILGCAETVPTSKRDEFVEHINDISASYLEATKSHKNFMTLDFASEAAMLNALADNIEAALPTSGHRRKGEPRFLSIVVPDAISDALHRRAVPFPSRELEMKVRQFRDAFYLDALQHLVLLLRIAAKDVDGVRKQDRTIYRQEGKTTLTRNTVLVSQAASLLKAWVNATGQPVGLSSKFDTDAAMQRADGPALRLLTAVFGPLCKDKTTTFATVLSDARKIIDKRF